MISVSCAWDPSVRGAPEDWEFDLPYGFAPRVGDHIANATGAMAEVTFVLMHLDGEVTVYIAPCSCWSPRTFTVEDHEAWFDTDR